MHTHILRKWENTAFLARKVALKISFPALHSGSDALSSGKKLSSPTLTKTVVSMFIIPTNIYISTSCKYKKVVTRYSGMERPGMGLTDKDTSAMHQT